MGDKAPQAQKPHSLTLKDRKHLELEGIKDVKNYNDSRVVLETTLGVLVIEGQDLNIKQLSLEETRLQIEGAITNLLYSEKKTDNNFLKKLFK